MSTPEQRLTVLETKVDQIKANYDGVREDLSEIWNYNNEQRSRFEEKCPAERKEIDLKMEINRKEMEQKMGTEVDVAVASVTKILQIFIGVMIPIIIAIAGWMFSIQVKTMENSADIRQQSEIVTEMRKDLQTTKDTNTQILVTLESMNKKLK